MEQLLCDLDNNVLKFEKILFDILFFKKVELMLYM